MQYVLVTGAYGGMGKAAAHAFQKAGYFVFALDKNVETAKENPIKNILPIQADITNKESLENALQIVQSHTNHLDAILHFAGIYILDSLVEISEENFRRAFEINVFGSYQINRIFLPLLNKSSRILLTTSELAPLYPLPFTGLYAITKSTLDKYAYSLRMELQLLEIKVSVLRAGAVETDMLGVSTRALDRFCKNTQLYTCNAVRFQKIVNSVEARSVSPMRIARKSEKILQKRNPRFVYTVNRNPLLLLLNLLPRRIQFWVIRRILS